MAGILVASKKGGTGKSTLTTNLAVMRAIAGNDVCLVDCDTQSTSRQFIGRRVSEYPDRRSPHCVQVFGNTARREIEGLADRFTDIVVDVAGRQSMEMLQAMTARNIEHVIIPCQPSMYDLETLPELASKIEEARCFNEQLRATVVITRAHTNKKVKTANEARDFIEEIEGLALSSMKIFERKAYQDCTIPGLSAWEWLHERRAELPPYRAKSFSMKAADEMAEVYQVVFGRSFKLEGRVAA
ncbi:MAG: AAA family ATPase [Myxococcota bacterium]|nr:AAA family ATPase [Myxococcota bacterium]